MNVKKLWLSLGVFVVTLLTGCAGLSSVTQGEGGIMKSGNAKQDSQPPPQCSYNYGTARVKPRSNDTTTSLNMVFGYGGGTVTSSTDSALDSLVESFASQSGCFSVLVRGGAYDAIKEEQEIQRQNTRTSKRITQGTAKAAQYIILVDVLMNKETGGGMGAIGALLPGVAGLVAGGIRVKNAEATVRINIANVSTGEIVIDTTGSSKSTDIGFGGFGVGGGLAAGGGAWSSTPGAKRVAMAYADAWRQAVALMPARLSPPAPAHVHKKKRAAVQ